MSKNSMEIANHKLKKGAYAILDMFPNGERAPNGLRVLGFAADVRFWHYLLGPLFAVLFLRTYLIFKADTSLLFVRVRKQNNYKFKYVNHIYVSKYSCTVEQSSGPISNKIDIKTNDGRNFILKFSKTIRWNKPTYIAEALSRH